MAAGNRLLLLMLLLLLLSSLLRLLLSDAREEFPSSGLFSLPIALLPPIQG